MSLTVAAMSDSALSFISRRADRVLSRLAAHAVVMMDGDGLDRLGGCGRSVRANFRGDPSAAQPRGRTTRRHGCPVARQGGRKDRSVTAHLWWSGRSPGGAPCQRDGDDLDTLAGDGQCRFNKSRTEGFQEVRALPCPKRPGT